MNEIHLALEVVQLALLVYLAWPQRKSATILRMPLNVPIPVGVCQTKTLTYPDGKVREFHSNPNCGEYSGDLPPDDALFHKMTPKRVELGEHECS